MMNGGGGPALPSQREIQRALQLVTEVIAREVASPTACAPDWTDFEWAAARAVAAMHGVSPLLWRNSCWLGPAAWQRFLSEQASHARARYERIVQLTSRLDAGARSAGVAMTGLKGLALHQLGLYSPGERPMADIDVLVRHADLTAASRVLNALGFKQTGETWKERLFTPDPPRLAASLGEHSNNDLKVELHQRICERLPRALTDVSSLVFPRYPKAGLHGYDSRAKLMIHLLLHAAGSMAFQSLRLLQLHDIGLLSKQMQPTDWDELLALNTGQPLWFAFPPLALASRYCAAPIPERVSHRLGLCCPGWLRRIAGAKSLYEVSYSYLWVRAFPGFEWSRSARELIGYGVSRIRPDAIHLAERARTIQTHEWAAYGFWPRLSQGRRIAHWLVRRPARTLTMHAVNAALAQLP